MIRSIATRLSLGLSIAAFMLVAFGCSKPREAAPTAKVTVLDFASYPVTMSAGSAVDPDAVQRLQVSLPSNLRPAHVSIPDKDNAFLIVKELSQRKPPGWTPNAEDAIAKHDKNTLLKVLEELKPYDADFEQLAKASTYRSYQLPTDSLNRGAALTSALEGWIDLWLNRDRVKQALGQGDERPAHTLQACRLYGLMLDADVDVETQTIVAKGILVLLDHVERLADDVRVPDSQLVKLAGALPTTADLTSSAASGLRFDLNKGALERLLEEQNKKEPESGAFNIEAARGLLITATTRGLADLKGQKPADNDILTTLAKIFSAKGAKPQVAAETGAATALEPRVRSFVVSTAVKLDGAVKTCFDVADQVAAIKLLIALERYERVKGELPRKLSTMPGFIAVQTQPSTGKPFMYDSSETKILFSDAVEDADDYIYVP